MEDLSDDRHSHAFTEEYNNINFTLKYKDYLLKIVKTEEEFIAFCLHTIFQNERFQGKRLLDIGCGPTVHRMAFPSIFFSEIIVSDYSEYSREEVQKWLNNESKSEDWNSLIKLSAILQGYGPSNIDDGVNAINSRIRQKIKKVLPCDILQKEIFPINIGKFDVLFTSFCIEAACNTTEIYKSTIKKLQKYILPGGGLVMVLTINATYYNFDNETGKIPGLSISQNCVNEALKEAGFKKKHCFLIETDEDTLIGELYGIMVISALKE